jgi:hypothetical protein
MATTSWRWWLAAAGVCIWAALPWCFGEPRAKAKGADAADGPTPLYYSVGQCAQCHTTPPKIIKGPLVCRCTEAVIWNEHDKHRTAFAVLKGPRGKHMGEVLRTDVTRDDRCLSCHAVIIRDPKVRADSERLGEFSVEEGVSCVACHGAYKEWFLEHGVFAKAWREMSREDKETKKGMYDLWNPLKRAEKCASCHIGNRAEGKVLTHEMYAAGHPPLPGFEAATFSDQMPRHWQYLREKPPEVQQLLRYDGKLERTHLVLVSAAVSFREAMKLTAAEAAECARAEPDTPKALDLANFDCYACHHDLKSPSWRQTRGYVGKPGRPQPRLWPTTLVKLLLAYVHEDPKGAEAPVNEKMQRVYRAFDRRPFGEPAAVRDALEDVVTWSDALAQRVAARKCDSAEARRLLALLPALFQGETVDYDSARQLAWAYRTMYEEAVGKPEGAVAEAFTALEGELKLSLPAGQERSIEMELGQSLKTINDYDPARFQKVFSRLAAEWKTQR